MKIRTTQPSNNKYYIRIASGGYNGAVLGSPVIPGANVLCNCVGYANGRFNEIGEYGKCKYQLVCNAENFIEAAQKMGLKISSKPIQGGIMVWQKGGTLSGGDGAGHVAVVEEVYEDGSILTSESGWSSWAFKTIRRNNTNGRWGQGSAYRFRGCIINPAVKDAKTVPTPKLIVDGIGGANTVMAMQRFFGTTQDGVLSGQNKNCAKYYPALKAVEYGSGGSTCVKKLQKWIGLTQDGVWGDKTSKALQKKLGVTADGIFGTNSMKAWQKYLNENKKAVYPKQSPEVIDVSYVQTSIDWKKVKAAGIKGAIIRCGFRGAGTAKLTEDDMYQKHMKGAHEAGLPIGIYMFTEAINAAEGKAEAEYAIKLWKKFGYPLSFPIAVDTEDVYWYETKNGKKVKCKGRANSGVLSKAKRTEAIKAFCEEVIRQGYKPMIYASLSWLDNQLDMSKLPYDVWVAQYNSTCDYKGKYILWQYTSSGNVNGIKGSVDMSKFYSEYLDMNPEPEKPAKKETYTGEFPSIKKPKGELLGAKAYELAYKNAAADKAKYPDGKPTEAFKKALDKVYPDRKGWGAAPKVGASCDVFVGTCVRSAGIDSKFPRGLSFSYLPKSDKFEQVKDAKVSTLKDGDIILYAKDPDGGHICIFDKGKIKEASLKKWYGRTTNSVKTRLSIKGKKWVKVFRAKGTYDASLHKDDKGDEVKKLQKFLNWWDSSLSLTVDGIFGDKTAAAVKAFQSANGLDADGYFGAKSLAKAKEVTPRQVTWVDKANTWARKICADNRYHYNLWESGDPQSHKCPICSKLKYEDNPDDFGWNCIGLGGAIWHHGGSLGNTCNCHWITGPRGTGDKLLTLPHNEALALAKKSTGLNNIELIRNKNGIPKSAWEAGDICLKFDGNVFEHVFYYPGGDTVIDSTRIYTDKKKWTPEVIANQIKERSWKNYTAKVIIRYTGK